MKTLLLALLLLLTPFSAFAADWNAVDSFESYSVASLDTDNGGTGWSGAWAVNSGSVTVVSSPTNTGTRSMHIVASTGLTGDATRSLTTSVTSGIVRQYVEADSLPVTTKGFFPAIYRDTGATKFLIAWGVTGSTDNTLSFGDGTTYQTLSTSITAGTWHSVDVQFDQPNNRARARIDGGAWSAYVTAAGGSFTSINSFRVTTGDANAVDPGFHIDDISAVAAPTGFFQPWDF